MRAFFIIVLIACAYFVTTPKLLLFFDAPEYASIVTSNSFLQSLTEGHPPIKPVFMGILWILISAIRLTVQVSYPYAANLAAFGMGIIAIALFYHVCSLASLSQRNRFIAVFIYALFPAVWITSTNLMVESVLLPAYLFSEVCVMTYIYKGIKWWIFWYTVSIVLILGIHIEALIWIPTMFALPILCTGFNTKLSRTRIFQLMIATSAGIVISLIFYITIFSSTGKPVLQEISFQFFGRVSDHYFISEPLRAILLAARNTYLTTYHGFGGAVLIVIILLTILYLKHYRRYIILSFFIPLFLSGGVWTGDFMVRRVIFATVFFSLLIVRHLKSKAILIVLYLLPISMSNAILYFSEKPDMPISLMQISYRNLPIQSMLIQTHYLRPFSSFGQELFLVGVDDFEKLGKNINEGKNVLMDAQAITAPYRLLTGNNYHITSLYRTGISESQLLFKTYQFDLFDIKDAKNGIFTYAVSNKNESFDKRIERNRLFTKGDTAVAIGKAEPGSAVFFYRKSIFGHVLRNRIDYGDILTWGLFVLTGNWDPMGWTYADKSGVFTFPIDKKVSSKVEISGEKLSEVAVY